MPIFVLAGCWQKIEYTGPPIAVAKGSASKTVATNSGAEAKPADASVSTASHAGPSTADVVSAPPAPEFQPPPATPIPIASSPVKPKSNDDDRYAIPAKTDDAAASSRFAANDTQPPAAPEQQSPNRHTDATPVSATVEVTPPPAAPVVSPKVRHAAWILGSRLSLAALAHDRGMATNSIPGWLDESRSACKALGVTVSELPEPAAAGDASPASRQVIEYLISQGQRIGGELSKQYGPEQGALFEVALKSNLLILLYAPDSQATNSISAAISRAAPQAQLPEGLWSPLVERMNNKKPIEEVRPAVRQMHRDIDAYLAKAESGAQ